MLLQQQNYGESTTSCSESQSWNGSLHRTACGCPGTWAEHWDQPQITDILGTVLSLALAAVSHLLLHFSQKPDKWQWAPSRFVSPLIQSSSVNCSQCKRGSCWEPREGCTQGKQSPSNKKDGKALKIAPPPISPQRLILYGTVLGWVWFFFPPFLQQNNSQSQWLHCMSRWNEARKRVHAMASLENNSHPRCPTEAERVSSFLAGTKEQAVSAAMICCYHAFAQPGQANNWLCLLSSTNMEQVHCKTEGK